MEFNVTVRRIVDNDKPVKAYCSVTIDGQFTVHGVRVVKGEKGCFISMPYTLYKDAKGEEQIRDVFHPVTAEARRAMETAVLSAYEAKVAANADKTEKTTE